VIEFKQSWALILIVLPFIVYRFLPVYHTKQVALRFSFFELLINALGMTANKGATQLKPSRWQKWSLVFGWSMLVIAMAKPVILSEPQTREIRGRDLMVIVDLSGSMDQKDFTVDGANEEITRLDAAKGILTEFSAQREGDRLGLIVFGDAAYLQTPFTADLNVWNELLMQTRVAMAGQNTHLGDAIGLGIKHFIDNGESEQKVVLVLTDGNDTDSLVPPIEAAKVAAQYNVRIHMVAIGDPSTVGEQELDMDVIDRVASITGGESFVALSPSELERITQKINELEPALYQSYTFQTETSLHYLPILLMTINHLCVMWVYSLKRALRQRKATQQTKQQEA
jgi:Ca-activated chloride channel family protein